MPYGLTAPPFPAPRRVGHHGRVFVERDTKDRTPHYKILEALDFTPAGTADTAATEKTTAETSARERGL